MTPDSNGLWPKDPDGVDDNRTVDDLEIPDDGLIPDAAGYTVPADAEPDTDEWGDDADNRLVPLADDDPEDIDDLDR